MNKKEVCNCLNENVKNIGKSTFFLMGNFNNRYAPLYTNSSTQITTKNIKNLNTNRENCFENLCNATKQEKLSVRHKPTPWRMPYNHYRKSYSCNESCFTNEKIIKEVVEDNNDCCKSKIKNRLVNESGVRLENNGGDYLNYLQSRGKLYKQNAFGILPENKVDNKEHLYRVDGETGIKKNILSGTVDNSNCKIFNKRVSSLTTQTYQIQKIPTVVKKWKNSGFNSRTSVSSKNRMQRLKYNSILQSQQKILNGNNNCQGGEICGLYSNNKNTGTGYSNMAIDNELVCRDRKNKCIRKPLLYNLTFNIQSISNNTNPSITFNSTEPGVIKSNYKIISNINILGGKNTVTFHLPDGTYNNNIWVSVHSGGVSSSKLFLNYSFIVDTTPPLLTIINRIPILSNITTPQFTFNSTENATIIHSTLDFLPLEISSSNVNTIKFTTLPEGTYDNETITVIDILGNSSIFSIPTFTIDLTPPVVTITENIPYYTNNTTPTLKYTSNKEGTVSSALPYTTSNIVINGENTITFGPLSDASYINSTIDITDQAGNITTITINFIVYTQEPDLNVLTPIPSITNDDTPSFTFTSDIDGTITSSTLSFSSDTTVFKPYKTVVFTSLASGSYIGQTITVTDRYGNFSTLIIPDFTIDTVGPVITNFQHIPSTTNNTTPSITFTTSENGRIESNLPFTGDGQLSIGVNTITFSSLSDGTYSDKYVDIFDDVNNKTRINLDPFVIDTVAPLVSTSGFATPSSDNRPYLTFTSNKTGFVSSSHLFYGGSEVIIGSNTIGPFDLFFDGTYNNVTITVTDFAGNQTTVPVPEFTIDTAGPVITNFQHIPGTTNNTTPSITFTTSEDGKIESNLPFTGDGQLSSGVNTITFSSLSDGVYTFKFVDIFDDLNNKTSIYLDPFVIDTVNPVINITNDIPSPSSNTTQSLTFTSDKPGSVTSTMVFSDGESYQDVVSGSNTVIFHLLSNGTYSTETITVTDFAGNQTTVTVPEFIIDTVGPVITNFQDIPSVSNNTTPSITFTTSEDGRIESNLPFTGDGQLSSGVNTITFSSLSDGTYSGKYVDIFDDLNNKTSINLNSFVIDTFPPSFSISVLDIHSDMGSNLKTSSSEVRIRLTATGNTTGFTLASTLNISPTTINTLSNYMLTQDFTLNELSVGTYSSETFSLTDQAGNTGTKTIPTFYIVASTGQININGLITNTNDSVNAGSTLTATLSDIDGDTINYPDYNWIAEISNYPSTISNNSSFTPDIGTMMFGNPYNNSKIYIRGTYIDNDNARQIVTQEITTYAPLLNDISLYESGGYIYYSLNNTMTNQPLIMRYGDTFFLLKKGQTYEFNYNTNLNGSQYDFNIRDTDNNIWANGVTNSSNKLTFAVPSNLNDTDLMLSSNLYDSNGNITNSVETVYLYIRD